MPARQAVLFDMNGVIVDDEPLHFSAFRLALRAQRIRLHAAAYAAHFAGRTDRDGATAFAASAGAFDVGRVIADKAATYRRLAARGLRAYPGVAALLGALRQAAVPIALVTGAPRREVGAVLSALGLVGTFDAIVTGDDVRAGKPAPEGFLAAAAALGLAPASCVVVEDSPSGVLSARAAGMACVAVCHTHPADALAAADRIVGALRELAPADLVPGDFA